MNVYHVEWVGKSNEAIITVAIPTWFGFGTPKHRRFRGSGTVWRDAVTGERQGLFTEMRLSDIWTKAKWERDDAAQTVETR